MRARCASESSSRMRVMQAKPRPILRALERRSCGRLPTAIEMNTRLSTPSTISSVESVSSAIQACGSERNSKNARLRGCPDRPLCQTRPEYQSPAEHHVEHQEQHGGRAHVLRAAGELVELGARLVDDGLDRGVEELGRQHEDQAAAEDRLLDRSMADPKPERKQDHDEIAFQAKRRLMAPRGLQTLHRPFERASYLARTP